MSDKVGGLKLSLIGEAKPGTYRIWKFGVPDDFHRQARALGGGLLCLELAGAVLADGVDPAVGRLKVASKIIAPRQLVNQLDTDPISAGIGARCLSATILLNALQVHRMLRCDFGGGAASDPVAYAARLDNGNSLASVLQQTCGDDADNTAADDGNIEIYITMQRLGTEVDISGDVRPVTTISRCVRCHADVMLEPKKGSAFRRARTSARWLASNAKTPKNGPGGTHLVAGLYEAAKDHALGSLR